MTPSSNRTRSPTDRASTTAGSAHPSRISSPDRGGSTGSMSTVSRIGSPRWTRIRRGTAGMPRTRVCSKSQSISVPSRTHALRSPSASTPSSPADTTVNRRLSRRASGTSITSPGARAASHRGSTRTHSGGWPRVGGGVGVSSGSGPWRVNQIRAGSTTPPPGSRVTRARPTGAPRATGPVRSFGPARSMETGILLPTARSAARTPSIIASHRAGSSWAQLIRASPMPRTARSRTRRGSSAADDGNVTITRPDRPGRGVPNRASAWAANAASPAARAAAVV